MQGLLFDPVKLEHRLPEDLKLFLQEKGFRSNAILEAALDEGDQGSAESLLESLEAPVVRSRPWSVALMSWFEHGGSSAAKRHRRYRVRELCRQGCCGRCCGIRICKRDQYSH